jgi:DNA (cytosine-5)-methyltransferase 1
VHTQATRLFIENVIDFRSWGPLDENGRPVKEQKGLFFRMWFESLRQYYPNLEARDVTAADYGDPTMRQRLLILGTQDGGPLQWPAPTHGAAGSGLKPFRTARDIVQWDVPGVPVGVRRKDGYFARVNSRHGTNERLLCIEAGIRKFGGEPFVLRRNQHDNAPETNAKSIDEPLHTVTAGSSDIALIVPKGKYIDRALHRMLNTVELRRSMSLSDDYTLFGKRSDQVRMIGNAVPRRVARAHFEALLRHPLEARSAA